MGIENAAAYSSSAEIIGAASTATPGSIAAERARAAYAAATSPAPASPPPGIFEDTEPFIPAKDIDPYRIAELAKLTPEIHLQSPDLGDVFLVAQHTGNPDRYELTYSEAATLRLIVDAFPGARVVALRPATAAAAASPQAPVPRPAAPTPEPEPAADWDAL